MSTDQTIQKDSPIPSIDDRVVTIPVLRHGLTGWDTRLMPKEEFDGRLARLRDRMTREGVDAVLTYGNAMFSGGVAYLSGFHVNYPARGAFVLVTAAEGRLIGQMPARNARAMQPHVSLDIQPMGSVARAIQAIREEIPDASTVVVAGLAHMFWEDALRLREAFPDIRAVDWVDELRRGKSDRELAIVARSAQICDAMLADAEAHLVAETTEEAFTGHLDYEARVAGSQDVRILLGTDGGLRRPLPRRFAEGDVVRVLVSVQWRGYWASAGATFEVGSTSPRLRETRSRMEQALPTLGESDLLLRHGIGMDEFDLPRSRQERLQPRDVVVLAALDSEGVVLVAGTGVVGEDGIRMLTLPSSVQAE